MVPNLFASYIDGYRRHLPFYEKKMMAKKYDEEDTRLDVDVPFTDGADDGEDF